MTPAPRQQAFTIMELIVAISIAGVMVLMINVLFQESVRAVNLGAGTSRVLQQTNTINTQLAADFGQNASEVLMRNSLPDSPGEDRNNPSVDARFDPDRVGFLMIAHHQIQNSAAATDETGEVFLRTGERRTPFIPDDSDGDGDADIRSDQLVFLRNLYPGERAITPQNRDSVGNDNPADNTAAAARIWYGHVVPTNNRGDNANDDPAVTDSTDPDFYDFYDRPANQWTLGRQALYFTGADATTPKLVDPASDTATIDPSPFTQAAGGPPSDEGLTLIDYKSMSFVSGDPTPTGYPAIDGYPQPSSLSIDWFDRMAASNAEVDHSNAPGSIGTPRLYMGLTDVVPAAAEHLFYTVFFDFTTGVQYFQGGPLTTQLNPADIGDNTTYATNAAELGFAFDRLWVNPRPHDTAGNPARLIEAWQQAQMHPYLAAGVSDFEVHFAGDYTEDATAADFDGRIDLDGDGNIIWYNAGHPDSAVNNLDLGGDGTDDIVVPETKSTVNTAGNDPAQVPIQRFAGGLTSTPDHADLVFVWRHDEPESWPDLIRIRYRIHDADGRISDRQLDTSSPPDGIPDENTAVPGRLVEVIFRVPG
ncbi:MAG: type II secretion system protein [Planctomycetota bacterium]